MTEHKTLHDLGYEKDNRIDEPMRVLYKKECDGNTILLDIRNNTYKNDIRTQISVHIGQELQSSKKVRCINICTIPIKLTEREWEDLLLAIHYTLLELNWFKGSIGAEYDYSQS